MKTLIVFTSALALVLGTAASASTAKTGFFRTANKTIYCDYGYGGGAGFIECGIRNGFLMPKPKNTCTHIDYAGNRIAMTGKGKAQVVRCAGDAGPFANPKAAKSLRSGRIWKGGPFTCKIMTSAVKCHNKRGHGFYIPKGKRYRIW